MPVIASVVIGQSYNFGFDLRTVNCKILYYSVMLHVFSKYRKIRVIRPGPMHMGFLGGFISGGLGRLNLGEEGGMYISRKYPYSPHGRFFL